MITCACNVHFYIEKLGFTGVYIIFFIIFPLKHRVWVLVRTTSYRLNEAVLTCVGPRNVRRPFMSEQNFRLSKI